MNLADLWRREPAIVTATVAGVIDAGLVLATTFGLPVTPDQKVAVDGFVSAALAMLGLLVAGSVTRANVTPTTDLTPPAPGVP